MSESRAESIQVRLDRAGRTFTGGQAALVDVSFEIRRGQFVALVGPSGCGKSTLLRLIAGLLPPSAGRVEVAGRPAQQARRDCRVGFVFQDPRLLPWRTALENVGLPLELERASRERRQSAATAALGLVGLSGADSAKLPRMLSGGMRMRVSLARALVARPELLLLDEPFAALDDLLRQQLNEELLRIWCQRRWTAAFVTHNVAEAVYLSERILVLTPGPGRIAAEVPVPFPYPRGRALRATGEFARLTGEVSACLRESAR
jgi:NitT/TauT family transport system ATP-binding protein